jgi:hypothetical protein
MILKGIRRNGEVGEKGIKNKFLPLIFRKGTAWLNYPGKQLT